MTLTTSRATSASAAAAPLDPLAHFRLLNLQRFAKASDGWKVFESSSRFRLLDGSVVWLQLQLNEIWLG
jgi:hypothetical protein